MWINNAWLFNCTHKYIIVLQIHLMFTQTVNTIAATTMRPQIMVSVDNSPNIFPPQSTPRRSITESG